MKQNRDAALRICRRKMIPTDNFVSRSIWYGSYVSKLPLLFGNLYFRWNDDTIFWENYQIARRPHCHPKNSLCNWEENLLVNFTFEKNKRRSLHDMHRTYRVFIKYCVFFEDFQIFWTLAFLCLNRQTDQQPDTDIQRDWHLNRRTDIQTDRLTNWSSGGEGQQGDG